MIVTIAGAICSWLRIMNMAIAMISSGTTVATSLPVGVSPIVLATSARDRAGDAPAITKMSTAAMTFGR